MAPQFVKPYVKTNKNDVADAEAICEAVSRPTMRFVPMKNGEQQAVLALHRARQGFVRARTAQANQIRVAEQKPHMRRVGSQGCSNGATRTSPLWRWPTKTRASCGLCSDMIGTTTLAIRH